uniref:Pectinesterase n=1 Tax=Manihot esculenta TaxID=3983 RepID=A0A2C9WIA3_MANES
MKTYFYPTRGFRHPRFHRTVGIPIPESSRAKSKIITVSKDGKGKFKTVTDAIKSIPSQNKERVIIKIGPGVHTEKIEIEKTKPFITFLGDPKAMPTLAFGGTARKYGTHYSGTVTIDSDYFVGVNIIFQNTAPEPESNKPGGQAVALRINGDKAAFYNCKFLGFQDTLCDDRGHHFYRNCYIEGTVDFIFGRGRSLYLESQLNVVDNKDLTFITAQGKEEKSENFGYSFRKMPEVTFSYTEMGAVVNPLGWSDNRQPDRDSTVFFAEYKNSGPGSNPKGRVKFTKQLKDAQAKNFLSLGYIQGSKWLLPPPK